MAVGWRDVYIFVCIFLSFFASSFSYLDYSLENSKVCSILRKRELKLNEKDNSAILLKEFRYFDNWSGNHQFNCNFTVLAPWGYGIIAVIQNLDLRQNETTKECIDYVQKRTVFFLGSERSAAYCGIVNSIRDPDASEETDPLLLPVAHNAFVDHKGRMDVYISVAGQRLMPPQKLDIAIVFTAFRKCKNDEDGFKECKSGSQVCIWEGFFHDKIINCPYNDCLDEGGCPVISSGGKKQSSGLGTKVTIGAVVLILGLLLLFMLCLFICRRCQVLCWSTTQASRPQRSAQQSSRVEMTTSPNNGGVSSEQNQPTAPPLLPVSSGASPVHEDKDLPPPYESLFPTR